MASSFRGVGEMNSEIIEISVGALFFLLRPWKIISLYDRRDVERFRTLDPSIGTMTANVVPAEERCRGSYVKRDQ